MGGVFGLCAAMVGAVENQFLGTLHFHGLAFLVNIYQYSTLTEIANAIEEKRLLVDVVKEWHCWVCREEHFDLAGHKAKETYFLTHGGGTMQIKSIRSCVLCRGICNGQVL